MPIVAEKFVYLACPRTGTHFVMDALKLAGVAFRVDVPFHSSVIEEGWPKFVITSVRSPHRWLRSRWALKNWDDVFAERWVRDIDEFVNSIRPIEVWEYFLPYIEPANFVMQTESIRRDLCLALQKSGTRFSEDAIFECPAMNYGQVENVQVEHGLKV